MKVLVFDTETTGLPPKNISTQEINKFPYVVQLSWMVFDTGENKIIGLYDYIIQLPLSIEIPYEASNIHGINTELMRKKGKDMLPILKKFRSDILTSHIVVAHNIAFDKKIIEVEFYRHGLGSWASLRKREFCTMKEGDGICNLKMKSFYSNKMISKYPRLSELHYKLFEESPKNIHNALIDILMCFRCYYSLEHKRDIMETNTKFAYLYKLFCKL